MSEKVIDFKIHAEQKNELDNIKKVVDKLLTTQNASVFDKVCKLCEELYQKLEPNCNALLRKLEVAIKEAEQVGNSLLTLEDRQELDELISILKGLKANCERLSDYKKYLITVVNMNNSIAANTISNGTEPDVLSNQEESVSQGQENTKGATLVLNNGPKHTPNILDQDQMVA